MDRLYASGCQNYTSSVKEECLAMARIGSFAGCQLFCTLLVLYNGLNRYLFSSSRLSKFYGPKYSNRSPRDQRHLRLIHVGLLMSSMAAPSIAIPISMVLWGEYTWLDSFGTGITLADMAIVPVVAFPAWAVFDLIYSEKLPPLYIMHHLGIVLAMEGTATMIMNLPTNDESRVVYMSQALQVITIWGKHWLSKPSSIALVTYVLVLLSSIGDTVSRIPYLIRNLFSWSPRALQNLLSAGFTIFVSITFLEAAIVAHLLLTRRNRLPTHWALPIYLLQALFTVTKYRTAMQLFNIWQKQKTDNRKVERIPKM